MGDEREQTAMEQRSAIPDATDADDVEDEDEEVASPFDHPAFLPVILLAMALWFGYDGWFSDTIESVNFNRYGFFFLAGAALYFVAADYTQLRFLLPALFAGYGLWLGAFHLFGPPDAWWKESAGGPLSAANFNRYGALACFALAAVALLRDLLRKPRSEPA
jgi:hypothetical protein